MRISAAWPRLWKLGLPLLFAAASVAWVATPVGRAATSDRADELIHAALQLDRNVARGKTVYVKECASCHGSAAQGDPQRLIPALAGQRHAYLIKQLADFTELERDSADMHRVVS